MAADRIAVAQRGVVLADVVRERSAPRQARRAGRAPHKRKPPEGRRRADGTVPVAGQPHQSRAAATDRGHRDGDRRRVHAPPVEAGALRHRPGATAAHPAIAGRPAHRRRVPPRARRPRHSAARCAHAIRRAGRVGEQGGGLAVPGRDDRHHERADVCGDQGRPRSGGDVPARCGARVLERRARSTAPCSGTASRRSAAGPTASAPGRRRASRCARCSTARRPTSNG